MIEQRCQLLKVVSKKIDTLLFTLQSRDAKDTLDFYCVSRYLQKLYFAKTLLDSKLSQSMFLDLVDIQVVFVLSADELLRWCIVKEEEDPNE